MSRRSAVRQLKFYGWGYEDQQPPFEEVKATAAAARKHLGFAPAEVEQPARIEDIRLPAPRLEAPASLASICSSDPYERITHAYGKAYRDLVRAFRGRIDNPPDVVARPRDEADVERVLEWCASAGASAILFGGGTSVVGGVEPRGLDKAVSIDMGALDQVLEVDRESRAALIEAGATGPHLEDQLRAHGLTLRHYPQSFEYSTLGGWIATRAGGHFATLMTHIDDLVESVRAVTPAGTWESRRLPASGAGPDPDRLLLGSEGTLGIVTQAWMRVQERPQFRAGAGVLFDSFEAGVSAARDVVQAGLWPSNCRLLDPAEAGLTGAAPPGKALLVLGFESADHPLDAGLDRALELCAEYGGDASRKEGAGTWRDAFLQAPYLRDTLIAAGVVSDTFETAITWDRLPTFIVRVRAAAEAAVAEECGAGRVSCRLTHVYPDGAAPYFTVLAPARRGSELEQWDAIKAAASEAVAAAGGTITHHHAVGRDHRPWYDRERPDPFALALRGAKRALDPAGIMNPGVLIDP